MFLLSIIESFFICFLIWTSCIIQLILITDVCTIMDFLRSYCSTKLGMLRAINGLKTFVILWAMVKNNFRISRKCFVKSENWCCIPDEVHGFFRQTSSLHPVVDGALIRPQSNLSWEYSTVQLQLSGSILTKKTISPFVVARIGQPNSTFACVVVVVVVLGPLDHIRSLGPNQAYPNRG